MKNFFVLLFIFIVSAAFAQNSPENQITQEPQAVEDPPGKAGTEEQSSDTISIYLSSVTGGSTEEMTFFNENLRAEIIGGGYSLAETRAGSDFYMEPTVDDTETPHFLSISLFQTRNSREIITLSWDYNALTDMYTWTPYIIFQLMANAPIVRSMARPREDPPPPKPPDDPPDGSWQNKWLWIGPVGVFGFLFKDTG
ncbi:MAG: hypothetical protein LBT16_01145, partial [Treponema sp.]|nr:hypothetical protein [Treponema sp.]